MNIPTPPEPRDVQRPIGPAEQHEPCLPEWVVERVIDGYAIWINRSTDPPMRRCIPLNQP